MLVTYVEFDRLAVFGKDLPQEAAKTTRRLAPGNSMNITFALLGPAFYTLTCNEDNDGVAWRRTPPLAAYLDLEPPFPDNPEDTPENRQKTQEEGAQNSEGFLHNGQSMWLLVDTQLGKIPDTPATLAGTLTIHREQQTPKTLRRP